MVPMTLVKEFQPITHQYNNNNKSQTLQRKEILIWHWLQWWKWHEKKNEFETSNLDIKKTTYVSWNTSGQIDYQDWWCYRAYVVN
jgi:hypothetical protein